MIRIVGGLLLVLIASAAHAEDFDRHSTQGWAQAAFEQPRARHRERIHQHLPHVPKPTNYPERRYADGLTTIPTAAGISITVAQSFAPKIAAFIADVVARGYKPPRIHCYSTSASHVRNSLHFSGQACDFNQRGWGKTDAPMYHVADIAARHGLRDGCTFRDCGHIDAGYRYARVRHTRHVRYARR